MDEQHKTALDLLKSKTGVALWDVVRERARQIHKWGEQDYPGVLTNSDYEIRDEAFYKDILEVRRQFGALSWGDILLEEVSEVFAAGKAKDNENLREELVQVAAVCIAWVESLDTKE